MLNGASQVALVVKNLPANAQDLRDESSISGLGRSPGEENGNPCQYSCLENPMDRRALRVIIHGVAKSWTFLMWLHTLLLLLLLSRLSGVRLCATPWTVARQAHLSMGFSRQGHWSGLPCPLPGDLPNPEMEPASLTAPALAGRFFTTRTISASFSYQLLYLTILWSS